MSEVNMPTIEDLWYTVKHHYNQLLENLPTKIDYEPSSISQKNLPLLARFIITGLKCRTVDLTGTVIKLIKEDEILPAIIITRSIYETVSLLFYLHQRIERSLKNREVKDIEKFITRMAWGGKSEIATEIGGEKILAHNILNAFDKLDKEIENSREYYGHVSEFAHPNYHGVLGCYCRISKEDKLAEFSSDISQEQVDVARGYTLNLLCLCLDIFVTSKEQIRELLPDFEILCNTVGTTSASDFLTIEQTAKEFIEFLGQIEKNKGNEKIHIIKDNLEKIIKRINEVQKTL